MLVHGLDQKTKQVLSRILSKNNKFNKLYCIVNIKKIGKYVQDRKDNSTYSDIIMPVQLDHQSIHQEIYSVLYLN